MDFWLIQLEFQISSGGPKWHGAFLLMYVYICNILISVRVACKFPYPTMSTH